MGAHRVLRQGLVGDYALGEGFSQGGPSECTITAHLGWVVPKLSIGLLLVSNPRQTNDGKTQHMARPQDIESRRMACVELNKTGDGAVTATATVAAATPGYKLSCQGPGGGVFVARTGEGSAADKDERGGAARQGRQQGQRGQQGTRKRRRGEHAHGRQRQHRGEPGQLAPSLPGARATHAQPASGGGCLPQPGWAISTTRLGARQGHTKWDGMGGGTANPNPHRHRQPSPGCTRPSPPPRVPLLYAHALQAATPPSTTAKRTGPSQYPGVFSGFKYAQEILHPAGLRWGS